MNEVERNQLRAVVKKLFGSSQKIRRARILLKADASDSNWTDARIAEAFDCCTKTVEDICKRLVKRRLELALNGNPRSNPPAQKRFYGEQKAQIIVLRLGISPTGYSHWSLRLLARKVVVLSIVESVSHETVC